MIDYRYSKPALAGYRTLFESTGWTSSIRTTDAVLKKAIQESWCWVCAFDGEDLIGVGRLISDGALYALVCDMIVRPAYQRQGIGTEILKRLKERCAEHQIQRVWLCAAPGRAPFYIRNGFDIRPADAPGMQMRDILQGSDS